MIRRWTLLASLLTASLFVIPNNREGTAADNEPDAGATRTESPPGGARKLEYFGFVGVDCGVDDPGDAEAKTNYIDEVAGFTNIAHLSAPSPESVLADRLRAFSKAGVKAILDVQGILFERKQDPSTGSGNRVWLRPDAETRWTEFVRRNRESLTPEFVVALYVVDEPVWNGLAPEEFERGLKIIGDARLALPTLAVEAYPTVNRIMVPKLLDWVGFDRYDSLDPATDPAWQADLKTVKAARSRPDQRLVVIASTQWLPYYQKDAGVRPEDMERIATSYYRVARSNPEVIALIGYVWPGGLDDPKQLGARRLPENVKTEFRRIGQAITGKK